MLKRLIDQYENKLIDNFGSLHNADKMGMIHNIEEFMNEYDLTREEKITFVKETMEQI